MQQIQRLEEHDFEKVRNFYWALIDGMQTLEYRPGWMKGVYPSDEFLMESLIGGNLYALNIDGQIAAAMVMNHECNDGYADVKWSVDAAPGEVSVIHALGVIPSYHRCGLAKRMVRNAIHNALSHHQKAIRLDVLEGNKPARGLYESLGFQHRQTVNMFYEDTGWTNYLLYELVLQNQERHG